MSILIKGALVVAMDEARGRVAESRSVEDAKAELFAKRIDAVRLDKACCHSVATAAASPRSAAEGNELGPADGSAVSRIVREQLA